MRLIVFLLLLANIALLAYMQYGRRLWNGDASAVAQQIHPDRVRLLSAAEIADFESRMPAGCLEFGPLAEGDSIRAREAIQSTQPNLNLAERQIDAGNGSSRVFLQIRQPTEALRKRLLELSASFAGAEMRVCVPDEDRVGR